MIEFEIQKEKLNFIKNEMTLLWGSVFLVGGGSLALMLDNANTIKYILGTVGIILTVLFLNGYFEKRSKALKIIKDMEQK